MYIDIHRHGKQTSENVLTLTNLFPEQINQIKPGEIYSVGLHPWHVGGNNMKAQILSVNDNAHKKEVIAIGEIGLDQKVSVSYLDQINAFEQQLEIAEKNNLPVIIHCVKAYNDIISIRKRTNTAIPWIIHWFNASEQIAQNLINQNCYLSFGYMLFKENSKAYSVFSKIPLENIFLETDDTEYSIKQVYHKAAHIKKIDPEIIHERIKTNFNTCFNQ